MVEGGIVDGATGEWTREVIVVSGTTESTMDDPEGGSDSESRSPERSAVGRCAFRARPGRPPVELSLITLPPGNISNDDLHRLLPCPSSFSMNPPAMFSFSALRWTGLDDAVEEFIGAAKV